MPTPAQDNLIESAPLTEAQSGLWYAQRLDPDNPVFNVAHAVELRGELDIPAFEQAFAQAVAETESFALCFTETADGPQQFVDNRLQPQLERRDLSTENDPAAVAHSAMRAERRTAVDPTRDRLAASILFVLAPCHYLWYLRVHHLAIDGYGMTLFADRVAELYNAAIEQRDPAAALPSFDVVLTENETYRTSVRRDTDAAFWRDAFSQPPTVVGMASGRAVSAHDVHRFETAAPDGLVAGVHALADTHRLPWPDVLTVLVALYCQRMTTSDETVVGVPHMGRFGSRAARVPAMVMNVLPLHVQLDEEQPLAELCATVSKALAQARRHGHYRSEQLRRDLGLLGGERRLYGPLINVLPFSRPPRFASLDSGVEVLATGPVDDITMTFRGDVGDSLSLEIEANPDLYSVAETQAHAHRLGAFLKAALTAGSLTEVPTASPAEIQRVIYDCNATDHAVPDTTLHALIEASMRRTPQAEALVFGDKSLTYAELDQRSAALASALIERGVGAEAVVAVPMRRSLELLIALVATLRASAAYLPLDPDHPCERLQHLIKRTNAACALVADEDIQCVGDATEPLPLSAWPMRGTTLPDSTANPNSAAYILFTSGSTGEPKSVVIEHRAIVNRLEWMRTHYGFNADDRIMHKTPTTFDVSLWELFLPLITGATVVIAQPNEHRDPRALAQLIRSQSVTTMHFVPSMLAAFLSEPSAAGLSLKRVFCSGEALGTELRDQFHALIDAELHNLYGPTEGAVDVSYWPAAADDQSAPIPIGFPVWNTRLYILDDQQRPVPPGVVGHLMLGGMQLARGYLGRADLTNERFVADPFVPDARMYHTGDLAWRREDGAVVYLGRSDNQVKIRGMRIEPGEIEAVLADHDTVQHASVIAREDHVGTSRLVGYIVPTADYDELRLRDHLAAHLPDYMVPSAIVTLDGMPVTANGKLDRKALPAPYMDTSGGRPTRPGAETELAQLFVKVLDLNTAPGADGDFFSLGGDSLLAVQLMLRISQRWGHDPGLGTLFKQPTVAALAQAIDADEQASDHGLAPLLQLAAGHANKAPLFLVHPAGGIAWCYRHLARALAVQGSVYGLQAPTLDPSIDMPENIDALACEYVERIRRVQPQGPYRLGGWSVGGIIAHAMAVRLRQLGETIDLLTMFDAYPSDCWRAEPEPDEAAALRALLAIAGHDPDQHQDLTSREAIIAFLRQGGSALGSLPQRTLDGVVRVVTDTNRLVRGHYHGHFDGTLTHVRAARDHTNGKLTPEQWAPYVASIDVIDVPFMHAELTGIGATNKIAPALQLRLSGSRI